MLLKEAELLLNKSDSDNWEDVFKLLKDENNPKIRLLAIELLVQNRCFEKIEEFLKDNNGHVRKYANLQYY